jgi:hypothetical protein
MTWAFFLRYYWGPVPSYKSASDAERKTEICLRSFGQIARPRPMTIAPCGTENLISRAINGCGKMRA